MQDKQIITQSKSTEYTAQGDYILTYQNRFDKHSITAAFDFTTFSDVPEEYALGAEYTYSDIVSLRAGYLFGQDQMGFSAGIGIKYDGPGFIGKFDYAISPTFDLGLVNRFTIGLSL